MLRTATSAPSAELEKARQLHGAGRLGEAVPIYRRILNADPRHAEALHLLGVAHFQVGDNAEALALIDRALLVRPRFPEALNNRGNALKALGRVAEARQSYRAAIDIAHDYATAQFHLAVLDGDAGDLEAAVASYRKALRLRPDFADAHSNLGTALRDLGRLEEAVESYEKALALRPPRAETLGGLGVTFARLGRNAEALDCYDRALTLDPGHVDSHVSRAMLLLSLGRFAEGWPEFEFRLRQPGFARTSPHGRLWTGEAIEGRTVLCLAEQGRGDNLQFVRFAALLAERGARVLVEAPDFLAPALGMVDGIDVVAEHAVPPGVDFHVPLMSLPGRLGIGIEDLPARVSYVRPEPDRVSRWAGRLPAGMLRVGIAWQGNPDPGVDRGRSPPLAALAPLFTLDGAVFVSLQKGTGVEQLATNAFDAGITAFGDDLDADGAFLDTAAILANLDLVISSDTAIAHLAGAMGAPVFLLLQHSPDWRWLRDRDDSPWYPSMRLFRQDRRGDWSGPVARLHDSLKQLMRERIP